MPSKQETSMLPQAWLNKIQFRKMVMIGNHVMDKDIDACPDKKIAYWLLVFFSFPLQVI